jgi:hypothetical protein
MLGAGCKQCAREPVVLVLGRGAALPALIKAWLRYNILCRVRMHANSTMQVSSTSIRHMCFSLHMG